MRVLITGADGFIGQNLRVRLSELNQHEVLTFVRGQSIDVLSDLVNQTDWIFHLAGINRPLDPGEFQTGNADLTDVLCSLISKSGRIIPIVFSVEIQEVLLISLLFQEVIV